MLIQIGVNKLNIYSTKENVWNELLDRNNIDISGYSKFRNNVSILGYVESEAIYTTNINTLNLITNKLDMRDMVGHRSTITSTLYVSGDSTFESTVTANKLIVDTINCNSSITVNNNLSVHKDLCVSQTSTLNDVIIKNNATIDNILSINNKVITKKESFFQYVFVQSIINRSQTNAINKTDVKRAITAWEFRAISYFKCFFNYFACRALSSFITCCGGHSKTISEEATKYQNHRNLSC